ncbi:MAG: hypothetical protein SO125_07615 [Eubacteriales bacterium]|nr:hypothetical protein [Eubacteriales bacterium]
MKKNKNIMSDAIGRVSQKYVNEYIDAQPQKRKHHARFITVVAAALVVVFTIAAISVILNRSPQPPDIPDIDGLSYDMMTCHNGKNITHVVNGYLDPNAASYLNPDETKTATEMAYAWDINIENAKKSKSPNSLIFCGIPIQTDTYCFDEQVVVNDSGDVVVYDAASQTTSIKSTPGYTARTYVQTRRTMFNIITVQITDIYKIDNTTGYNVGDVIYLYNEIRYSVSDGGEDLSPAYIECVRRSYGWGKRIGEQTVFIVSHSQDLSYVSGSVKSTGILTEDVWHVQALCSLENYKNQQFYDDNYSFAE